MKKITVKIILIITLFFMSGCLYLFMDMSGNIDTDDDYTPEPPVILFLTVDGVPYEKKVNKGIARRGERYRLMTLLDGDESTGRNFSVCLAGGYSVQQYGYDSLTNIVIEEFTDEQTTAEWYKRQSADAFSVDITRWDDRASFSFNAQIRKKNESADSGELSEPIQISGHVENAPFYNDPVQNGDNTLKLLVNGEEKSFFINDNVVGMGKYEGNIYCRDDSYDPANRNDFQIRFLPSITVGDYSSDSRIYISLMQISNGSTNSLNSDTATQEGVYLPFSVNVSRWDSAASFSVNGQIVNGKTGEACQVSCSVSDLAINNYAAEDMNPSDLRVISYTVDGTTVSSVLYGIYMTPEYSGSTYTGVDYYNIDTFSRKGGIRDHLMIRLPSATGIGTYTTGTSGMSVNYQHGSDSDTWSTIPSWGSDVSGSTYTVTVSSWSDTATISYSATLGNYSNPADTVQISGTITSQPLYKYVPYWAWPDSQANK